MGDWVQTPGMMPMLKREFPTAYFSSDWRNWNQHMVNDARKLQIPTFVNVLGAEDTAENLARAVERGSLYPDGPSQAAAGDSGAANQQETMSATKSKRGTMPVRTGILGVGFMGRVHADILRRDRRVELSGVFDVDRQRGEEAAKELNCTLARTEEELFERSDAIYITVPNTLHAPAAGRALQHGKHVFLEKPFATTLAEADSLRLAASRANTILQVGHNRRFAPAYQAVKDCLKAEDIEPTLAHFKMNRASSNHPPGSETRRLPADICMKLRCICSTWPAGYSGKSPTSARMPPGGSIPSWTTSRFCCCSSPACP